jgi:phenazine biosynthesis protein phzE
MSLLEQVLGPVARPYALLHRPESPTGAGHLELLVGTVTEVDRLDEIDWRPDGADLLTVLPYRLIGERGYDHHDDGEPLLVMAIEEREVLSAANVLAEAAARPLTTTDGAFDLDDAAYAELVHRVLSEEIGTGTGSNFVLKREFQTEISDFSHAGALAFFGRLLAREPVAYWCFLIHTGTRTFVGASPERHLSVEEGLAVMNPVSGTYLYPPAGPDLAGLLSFLADSKETNELSMVLDEELKMMSRLCSSTRVVGPRLKTMAHLAHTEYLIEGRTDRDFRELLRETLFAPTVTGSPLESACRVIRKYEPRGRGYYSGVAALLTHDEDGKPRMDSAILIRTADIDAAGGVRISVGSTLVRDSDPVAEAAETRAKAAGLLSALHSGKLSTGLPAVTADTELTAHPDVVTALSAKNRQLGRFWLRSSEDAAHPDPVLDGRKLLIVDAEDTFTAMGAQLLADAGLDVTVRRFDEDYNVDGYDLVIVGPGPGDPRDHDSAKIRHLRELTAHLLGSRLPFLSICLGHQVLCAHLGLDVIRKTTPNQGVQRSIDLFGKSELVSFYNTYEARTTLSRLPGGIDIARNDTTGEVHALRGPRLASVQFHPASVMTGNGRLILTRLLTGLLDGEVATP